MQDKKVSKRYNIVFHYHITLSHSVTVLYNDPFKLFFFCSENVVCKEKCKTQRENILDHKSLFACLSYLKVNDKVPSSKLFFKCVSFFKDNF